MATDTKSKAEFTLELQDEMSGAAEDAAGALEKLRKSIDSDSRALAEMQKAMRNLQGANVVNVAQFRKLKEQIDLKKASIAQAQGSYIALGGTFNKTASSGKGFGSALSALQKQVQSMPGPVGQLGGRLGALQGMLAGGGAIAAGILVIVAALGALVVASVAATAALYKYGTAQADARRNELLRLEGLTKLRFWYQRTAGNAGEMQTAIDRVSASSALSRDKIAGYSEQLYRLGLRGDNLSKALEGTAIKASTQGDAAASAFAGWAATIGLAGGSVDKLVDKVKARLGGIADKQLSSSAVQAEKLKEAYNALFNGLSMDKYLRAWREVNELLGQSTASGRALKQLVEHILQPLIDSSTAAAPVVKRFFQGMILGALAVEIAILDLRLMFKRTFGDVELFKGLDKLELGLTLGKLAVYGLLAAFGLLAAVVVASLAVMVGPFAAVGAALFWIGWKAGELVTWWEKQDWGALGTAIVDGIVNSLKAGWSIIGETVSGLADEAVKSFKAGLGIASPSKVFADLGIEIPRGIAVGVEKGTPEARESVDNAVTPQLAPATAARPVPAPAGARAPQSAATVPVHIGEVHIHTSSDKPHDMALDLRRELESILQNVAIQLGAPEPEGT